jgi:hypothetical protein
VNERNIGLVPNFAECIRRRGNGYFTILGSDDALLPHFASSMIQAFKAFPAIDVVGARFCLAQNNVHNIVGQPPRSDAPARLLSAQDIIEHTVISMAAFMTRPGFDLQLDETFTYAGDQMLFRKWALTGARICLLPEAVSIYCQHDAQATSIEGTLLQYSEVMKAHAWVAQHTPEHYASSLIGRLDHCAYIRSQRLAFPHTAAVLGILERLIQARYVLATLHVRVLDLVFATVCNSVNTAAQDLASVVESMNQLLRSAPDAYPRVDAKALATSMTFPEDAPGATRLGHPQTVAAEQHLAVLTEALSAIYETALQAERLLPLAEVVDSVKIAPTGQFAA